ECGYLSNTGEATLLLNEDYQEKMAWAIHLGIFQYLNSMNK
ncbi:MAG: putative rane protein, partial [Anaerocolumna sp.]|nr:putative rane protein [Anaerocolumna sp.]